MTHPSERTGDMLGRADLESPKKLCLGLLDLSSIEADQALKVEGDEGVLVDQFPLGGVTRR